MKCHYDVLELSRDADDSEIKSAYRKLALKWHPDKNLDNPDLAKEQFQIVQQAYEVLSDRQERAWYDAHRDQILRGASSDFQDKSLDVFQYFTTTCYTGFTDEPEGFYTVYRTVFDQLAQEDVEFMDDKEEFDQVPGFGTSNSDYETVKAFYDHWMSYCTKKSYSWLDPYDIREGKGDRRVSKLIDKENKKVRQKAKKERNEEVRNLVAFVRKRDKRMQAFRKEQEAKTLENRKKQEERSKQKRLERQQMHAEVRQANWQKFDNVKSELEEIEKHLTEEFGQSEDEEEDCINMYCVACNKVFKNPKAFENHEVSKKHKENVERLRAAMIEEDMESNLSDDLAEYGDIVNIKEEEEVICEEVDNGVISGDESLADKEVFCELEEGEEVHQSKSKKKKKKKGKAIISHTVLNSDVEEGVIIDQSSSSDEFDFGNSKAQKKKIRRVKAGPKTTKTGIVAESEVGKEPEAKPMRKIKKGGSRKNGEEIDLNEIDLSHCCVTCQGSFPSKNKLFEHLKKSNHGVYLPKDNNNKKSKVKCY